MALTWAWAHPKPVFVSVLTFICFRWIASGKSSAIEKASKSAAMAASISTALLPLPRFHLTERPCLMMAKPWNGDSGMSRLRSDTRDISMILSRRVSSQRCTSCLLETAATVACTSSELHGDFGIDVMKVLNMDFGTGTVMNIVSGMLLGDIDPATAKVAISILGPILSVFSFLFIIRIVMSWYPKLPVGKFPYVVVYAPTEPILVVTRKVIPPLGGVDVTPVVWFGLLSFANEILVGPQGLLVLLSQQV